LYQMDNSLEGLSYEAIQGLLAKAGVNPVHAKVLFRLVQRRLAVGNLELEDEISPPLKRWLASEASARPCKLDLVKEIASADGFTRKYLLKLDDGAKVETVQMGFPGRYTACLSSQVGCAMGCVFCATGQMGFGRNLKAGEIVAQAHHIERELRSRLGGTLRNIVMMGMGEPLHNFDAVMEALDILTDDRGLNVGPARVSISTVGYVPGIQKLARCPKRYSLAVSLHGVNDEERGKLVPINRRWPLSELLEACREYSSIKRARVFFAWILIKNVNDSDDHARELAELLKDMNAHVNLIPLNPTEGFEGQMPAESRVRAFQQIIQKAGLPTTVRQRRGIDVAAGCGQLSSRHT
jgi:23S rRNA (adenine2503-C2)-methyltransferase